MSQEQSLPEKKIELHHASIEEIMGTPPASMVRAGSGILLVVILCLLIGTNFITYLDTVRAPAILSGNLPVSIQTAPETGRIICVLKSVNCEINSGDTLFQIEKNDGEILSLTASNSGILEINPLIEIKDHVQKNDTIAFIWDRQPRPVACVVRLSPKQGKDVKEGNKLRLYIDKYPSEEYGVVEAYVKSVGYFNSGKSLQVIAELPETIITSSEREIAVDGNVSAEAEIITAEKTIFDRLVNPFRIFTE